VVCKVAYELSETVEPLRLREELQGMGCDVWLHLATRNSGARLEAACDHAEQIFAVQAMVTTRDPKARQLFIWLRDQSTSSRAPR
jgi:hypothetical protein